MPGGIKWILDTAQKIIEDMLSVFHIERLKLDKKHMEALKFSRKISPFFHWSKRNLNWSLFFFLSIFFFFFGLRGILNEGFLLVVKRGFWTTSLNNFRNCKMRTAQILWSRLCLFSLRILRSSSTTWPELCECFLFMWLILDKSWYLFCMFWKKESTSPIGENYHWILFHLCREQKIVDFKQVDAHVHQFKGSSARYLLIFCFTLFSFIVCVLKCLIWLSVLGRIWTWVCLCLEIKIASSENMVLSTLLI